MDRMREALTALDAAVSAVADCSPVFWSTADKAHAVGALVVAESRLVALRLRVMACAGDLAEREGDRDVAAWLARTQRVRRADAAADLRLAQALDRDRVHLADSLSEARVNVAQARVIVAVLDDLPARVGQGWWRRPSWR